MERCGYDRRLHNDNPAHWAYNHMYQNAVFAFIGHGAADTNGYSGGLAFHNKLSSTYPTRTYFRQGGGVKDDDEVYLSALASSSLSGLLLAVNTGCRTAQTNPDRGNFTKGMQYKGADTALGFYDSIQMSHGNYFHKKFFYYCDNRNLTFADAAWYAATRSRPLAVTSVGTVDSMVGGVAAPSFPPS